MLRGKRRSQIRAKNTAKWEMKEAWLRAGQPTFSGPVKVDARFYFPDRRRRDRENYAAAVKAGVDLLVAVGCIERDDHEYFDMTVHMLYDKSNPRLELEIRGA
jgi:Holliday junction resolvase RusA-like endonuclease